MSSIDEFLKKILASRYGKDVRQSIHDAIEKIDEIAEDAQTGAKASASEAKASASEASNSESNASASATDANNSYLSSRSYAVGGTGTREGEDTDNSYYYYQKVKAIASGSGLIPSGTITFAEIPTKDLVRGEMYNIKDAFTSDERFADGAGIDYPAGTNIYWIDDKWDVMSPDMSNYLLKTGDTITNTTTFTDSASMEDLKSGETHGVLFGKISTALKTLAEKISALADKLTTDEGNISTAQSNIKTLQSDLATTNGNVSALENSLDVASIPSDLGATAGGAISQLNTHLTEFANYSRRTRKNITSSLADLSKAVAEQDLEKYGYSIGDYFTGASGYVYHLGDMDTYYGGYNSYAVVATHHVGIVVDTNSTCTWLSSGSAGSYSASTLHSYLKGTVLSNIKSDFTKLFGSSDHLVAHTELDNAVGSWGTTWDGLANTQICALSEVQVYGSRIFGCDGFQSGTANKHLEIFRKFRFNEILGNKWWWLRSLSSSSAACAATDAGVANGGGLSYPDFVVGLILFY